MKLNRVSTIRLATLSLLACVGVSAAAPQSPRPTLADSLYANYQKINTLSCRISKTTSSGGHTVRMLSRVYYKAGGYIHVDNVAPFKRTIIADGSNLYYFQEGQSLGFSRPVDELSPVWAATLRKIPATPTDHLYLLRDVPETTLPAKETGVENRGYQTSNQFVVVSASTNGQIFSISFYRKDKMQKKTGEYTYKEQREVLPGCWIATRQKAIVFLPGDETAVEQVRVSDLKVNQPLPEQLFRHEAFMKGVKFTDNFRDTFKR